MILYHGFNTNTPGEPYTVDDSQVNYYLKKGFLKVKPDSVFALPSFDESEVKTVEVDISKKLNKKNKKDKS